MLLSHPVSCILYRESICRDGFFFSIPSSRDIYTHNMDPILTTITPDKDTIDWSVKTLGQKQSIMKLRSRPFKINVASNYV